MSQHSLREALEWIVANAHNADALEERALCGDKWHLSRQEDDGTCPVCCSSWWALDGTPPAEEGSYALQAVARMALTEHLAPPAGQPEGARSEHENAAPVGGQGFGTEER